MPQRRMCSQVRVLARLVVGKSTLPSVCSTTRQRMPRQANSMASARPTGPAPAMRTGMRSVSLIDISLSNLFDFFSLAHRLQKSPPKHQLELSEKPLRQVNTGLGEVST